MGDRIDIDPRIEDSGKDRAENHGSRYREQDAASFEARRNHRSTISLTSAVILPRLGNGHERPNRNSPFIKALMHTRSPSRARWPGRRWLEYRAIGLNDYIAIYAWKVGMVAKDTTQKVV